MNERKKRKYIIEVRENDLLVGFSRVVFEMDCISDRSIATKYSDKNRATKESRRLEKIYRYKYNVVEIEF